MLFGPEEVRRAAANFLMRRRGARSDLHVDRVELFETGGVSGLAHLGHSPGSVRLTLDANELMTAILIFCCQSSIPLSSRSSKKLEVAPGGLALVMGMNLESAQPTVLGRSVTYTGADEREMVQAALKTQERGGQSSATLTTSDPPYVPRASSLVSEIARPFNGSAAVTSP